MTMHTAEIEVRLIDADDRLRPVDPAWAEALAAAMHERGLDQPIVVRPLDGATGAEFALVAGGHRLAAARLLGWSTIRAEVRDLDALEARLVEIDENLVRHELTALDRAIFLRERKGVWERLYPQTAHGGERKSLKRKGEIKSQCLRLDQVGRFSAEAAAKIGLSERTVQAAIELAEKLDPEAVALLRGTEVVRNGAALALLGQLIPEEQLLVATAIARGEARDVRQALVAVGLKAPPSLDPQEALLNRLVELYGRANGRTQRRFREHLRLKGHLGQGHLGQGDLGDEAGA